MKVARMIWRRPMFRAFSTQVPFPERVQTLKSIQEVEEVLVQEEKQLDFEKYCLLVERMIDLNEEQPPEYPISENKYLQLCFEHIFKQSLMQAQPLWVVSLIVSLSKAEVKEPEYLQRLELVLARSKFFEGVEDLDLIAIVVEHYLKLAGTKGVEEVLEMAERRIIEICSNHLKERGISEELQIRSIVGIANSYVQHFSGSPLFFKTLQNLIVKYQTRLDSSQIVQFLYSASLSGVPVVKECEILIQKVKPEELSEVEIHKYLCLSPSLPENMDTLYVDTRAELPPDLKPNRYKLHSSKELLLEDHEYYYCTCGLSNKQPYCDGSHLNGTQFKPLKFKFEEEDRIIGICLCKENQIFKGPFCDGSHKKLKKELEMK